MGRAIAKTEARGWYVDAATGKKVRKQEGDDIFDNILEAQEALAVLEKAHGKAGTNGKAAKEPAPEVTLTSGKTTRGKTLTIRCAWKEKGKRCTNERTIKPQDAFQVKYCQEHQKENSKKLKRERAKARRAAKAAAAATA